MKLTNKANLKVGDIIYKEMDNEYFQIESIDSLGCDAACLQLSQFYFPEQVFARGDAPTSAGWRKYVYVGECYGFYKIISKEELEKHRRRILRKLYQDNLDEIKKFCNRLDIKFRIEYTTYSNWSVFVEPNDPKAEIVWFTLDTEENGSIQWLNKITENVLHWLANKEKING